MGIHAGKYRFRFVLLRPKLDSDGELIRNDFGAPTGETEVVARPWCNIIDAVSSETVSVSVAGQETLTLEIRYSKMFENPSTDMYIEFEGKEYDITSAVDPTKRKTKMVITATSRRLNAT